MAVETQFIQMIRRFQNQKTNSQFAAQKNILEVLRADASFQNHLNPINIVLLREVLESLDPKRVGSDWVSESLEALELIHDSFSSLNTEILKRTQEFENKWLYRLSNEEIQSMLQIGGWFENLENGQVRFKVTNQQKSIQDFFYSLFHIPVGDAEKILVYANAQIDFYSEKALSLWIEQSVYDESSRLLPTLEKVLQSLNLDFKKQLRLAFVPLCQNYFKAGLEPIFSASYSSQNEAILALGKNLWDNHYKQSSAIKSYISEVKNLTEKMAQVVLKNSQKRLELFVRGWSQGQINLQLQES